jgi:hypothetical protein
MGKSQYGQISERRQIKRKIRRTRKIRSRGPAVAVSGWLGA